MNNKIKITLLACMLIATSGLLAQVQQKSKSSNLNFPFGINNGFGVSTKHLGKNGYQVKLDSITTINWNASTNSYEANMATRKFYYDSFGKNNLQVVGMMVDSVTYQDINRSEITYNENNKAILIFNTTIIGIDTWINDEKVEKNYDDKGNNTIMKFYQWKTDSNKWDTYLSIYLSYNNNHDIITEIDSLNFVNNKSARKIEFIYDNKGNNISNTTSHLLNTSWIKFSKIDYTFDEANNLTNTEIRSWDSARNEWFIGTKLFNTINSKGETIESKKYCWNGNNGPSGEPFRSLFTYNSSVNFDEVAWPRNIDLFETTYKSQILTINSQVQTNNVWVNNQLQTYHYSPFSTGTSINELTKTNINIYPNPSNGMINLITNETIENINITDVNGKLVHHQTNNSPIDLSLKAKGIYFVNITTEKGVINKKIVLN